MSIWNGEILGPGPDCTIWVKTDDMGRRLYAFPRDYNGCPCEPTDEMYKPLAECSEDEQAEIEGPQ